MSKPKNAKARPGRGTKGTQNGLLPEDLQGRAYRIKAFTIEPEVTLLTADGKEERRFTPVKLAFWEADFAKTLPEYLAKLGLKMEQGEGGK